MTVISRISIYTFLGAAFAWLSACDSGPKDVFSEREIAEFVSEFENAADVAKSTRGTGKPLMWTLSDEDTDIHMFGTIHVLPPGLAWRSDAFNAAFAEAHTLVMEVADIGETEDPDEAMAMLANSIGDQPLSELLSKRDYERLGLAANEVGIPISSIDVMKPWMAAVTLEYAMVYSEGFVDEEGVEVVLEREAISAGKKIAGLETVEFQKTIFENLSETAQIQYLVGSAAMAEQARDGLNLYIDEWLDGDFAGMSAFAISKVAEKYEGYREFNDLLLKNRNAAWVPQIEEMLNTPGTIMIAVGAGHLEGPDSVILMLREKGYSVEGP